MLEAIALALSSIAGKLALRGWCGRRGEVRHLMRNVGGNTPGTIGDLVCDAEAAGFHRAASPDWTGTGCWITRRALMPHCVVVCVRAASAGQLPELSDREAR